MNYLLNNLQYHLTKMKRKYVLIFQNIYVLRFLALGNKDLKDIIFQTRSFLAKEGSFIQDSEFSITDYGMSKPIYKKINESIFNFPTYTDIMLYSSHFLQKKKEIKYLEIGTSVLKNYFQMNSYLSNAELIAFDINPITKKYKSLFSNTRSFDEDQGTFYRGMKNNHLTYFRGSVLEASHLKNFNEGVNCKFDIIFSDALHTPEGVMSEFQNIISNNLNEEFILYFDDLDFPGLFDAAKEIFSQIDRVNDKVYFTTFKVYGWIGQHEKMHKNGIISNINFYKTFKKNKLYLPNLRNIKL